MKIKHAKSPCCGVNFIRYGGRRRQCLECKCTWRIRKKKVGRKTSRGDHLLLFRFLRHVIGSSLARADHGHKKARTLQRKLVRSRDLFCRTHSWPELPKQTPLILVADAMIKCINKRWYSVYCMFLRTARGKRAVIAPPVIRPGKESAPEWWIALDTIPKDILLNIKAIVCDGHLGMLTYAKRKHWLIQRCQFHLIASIQGRRSRWGKSRHRKEGDDVYKLVKQVLDADVDADIDSLLTQIDNLALSTTSPELRKVLRGFVNHAEDYRIYHYHPALRLPRTNNTGESFIGCIESLLHRMRGTSTTEAMMKWVEALVKFKKTILCNGFHQPN